MITAFLILYFAAFAFFIFYHFRFGIPEEFTVLRIIAKYLFISVFWLYFIFSSVNILINSTYTTKGDYTQKILINDEFDNIEKNYFVLIRNKNLNYKTEIPYYQWNYIYLDKFYIVPKSKIRSEKVKDTLKIAIDTNKYDRFIFGISMDSIETSSLVLTPKKNPFLLFTSDFKEINLKDIKFDLTNELNYFILFIVAILGIIYQAIRTKINGWKMIFKYLIVAIIITWSGFNIFVLGKLLYSHYFILA